MRFRLTADLWSFVEAEVPAKMAGSDFAFRFSLFSPTAFLFPEVE